MAHRVSVCPKRRNTKRKNAEDSGNGYFRVVGSGNYVYITTDHDLGRTDNMWLASKAEMERIMVGMNKPLELDVQHMSQAQLGNVLKAIRMVDSGSEKIGVSKIQKNGRPMLVAKKG